MGKCIIVSAGDFTSVDIARGEEDLLIACDAGFAYCHIMGIEPDLVIGDMDSVGLMPEDIRNALTAYREKRPDRVIELPVRKDDTDTMMAVKVGLENGYTKFFFYGALGGQRFDHSIANIQALRYLKQHGASGYLCDRKAMVLLAKDETVPIKRGTKGQISVFAVGGEAKGVTLKGLSYPLENAALSDCDPRGTSNEFLPDTDAYVTVKDGTLLIIITFT